MRNCLVIFLFSSNKGSSSLSSGFEWKPSKSGYPGEDQGSRSGKWPPVAAPPCSQGRFSILRVRILLLASWGWPLRVFITYFQFSALRCKVGLCFLVVRLESQEMCINFVHRIVSRSDTDTSDIFRQAFFVAIVRSL